MRYKLFNQHGQEHTDQCWRAHERCRQQLLREHYGTDAMVDGSKRERV